MKNCECDREFIAQKSWSLSTNKITKEEKSVDLGKFPWKESDWRRNHRAKSVNWKYFVFQMMCSLKSLIKWTGIVQTKTNPLCMSEFFLILL